MWICLKLTQAEILKKQTVLSALGDLILQLGKLSDDVNTTDSENSVKKIGEQLAELVDRLIARRTILQVSAALFGIKS